MTTLTKLGHMATGAFVTAMLCLAGFVSSPGWASTTTTATYVLGVADPAAAATVKWATRTDLGVACSRSRGAPGVGGACIALPPAAQRVSVTIDDVSGRLVGGTRQFVDARGFRLGTAQSFCHRHESEVPPGAVSLVVAVDSTVTRCGLPAGGVGTAGVIVVR